MNLKDLIADLEDASRTGKLLNHDESLATMHGKRVLRAILHELKLLEPSASDAGIQAQAVVTLDDARSNGQLMAAVHYKLLEDLREQSPEVAPANILIVFAATELPATMGGAPQTIDEIEAAIREEERKRFMAQPDEDDRTLAKAAEITREMEDTKTEPALPSAEEHTSTEADRPEPDTQAGADDGTRPGHSGMDLGAGESVSVEVSVEQADESGKAPGA